MTENTITFTPSADLRKGFKCLFKGITLIVLASCRLADRTIRRYPYSFIVAILLTSFVACFIGIAGARSERDAVNKKNYELQQRLDTLQMANEAKAEVRYVNYD